MEIKKTADGKMDKRTKEYKELKERLIKARATKAKTKSSGKTTSTLKRTASGKIDKRTKEGKAVAERMAKARRAKNSLINRITRLLK